MNTLAAGYVFGGWNFGPEGALFNYYQGVFSEDDSDSNDGEAYVKQYVRSKYGYGSTGATLSIPSYPDWDLSQWCIEQDLESKGLFPNDYISTFISETGTTDSSIVAGSNSQLTNPDGTTTGGGVPAKLQNFYNTDSGDNVVSRVNFNYVAKKIKFNRPSWLADYKVDIDLINCLAESYRGQFASAGSVDAGSYFGHWVEKGFDEFTIYVAFSTDSNNHRAGTSSPGFPAPASLTTTSGGKKKKTTSTITLSERGGERFSGFVVPVGDLLTANTNPISSVARGGYIGNPRIGKCTYPTVMWSITGIPLEDTPYFYGDLNSTNPTITLKS